MKRLFAFLLSLAMLFCLAACGGYSDALNIAGFDTAIRFQAVVIESHDDYLIVEPAEDYIESKSSDRIKVSIASLSLDETIKVGDAVEVYYEGGIQETYPAVASKVVNVCVIDPQENAPQSGIEPGVTYGSVSWANWSDDPKIKESALNKESLTAGTGNHIPVYKCDSLEDLAEFKTAFSEILDLYGSYNEVPSFEVTVTTFGEAFFADNSMILVYVEASSGSLRFDVEDYSVDSDTFCAHIVQTNNPEAVTEDMAGWLIIIPIGKDTIQNVVHYDAVLK